MTASHENSLEEAVFGAGCFWCVEAIFQSLKGVVSVEPGYMGGHVEFPTYEQICTGSTGHAEIAKISFDPSLTSYEELLEVFWKTHDPTTLNQQGADKGTQYRSVVFYVNEKQQKLAIYYKNQLDKSKVFGAPIITEISKVTTYFPAENYHKNYYLENSSQGYCQFVIKPKLEKLKKVFAERLKS